MALTTSWDNPNKPPPGGERTEIVFANYERSRRDWMERGQREKFKAFYKAYRAYAETADDGSTSNLSLPLIAAHVDSFYARLVGMRPVVDVQPRDQGDVQRAAFQRMLIDYQWDVMDMLLKAAELAKAGLIYGIGWGKCTWRREVRTRLMQRPLQLPPEVAGLNLGPFQGLLDGFRDRFLPKAQPEMGEVTVWDNPFYENLPVDQVYADPDGYSIDTCRYIIHRCPMTLDTLEALVDGGAIKVNRAAVARLKKAAREGSLGDDEDGVTLMQEAADVFKGAGDSALTEDPTKRRFHLLEHWTDERVRWAVAGNEQIGLIRDEPHALGMKPFIRFTPEPLPNELIGTSLTERLFSIWLEMTALKNARMDNIYRVAHPQIMIPRGSMTNPAHIRFKAGGYFLADPINPPQIFQYPELKIASYREQNFLEQQAEQIGGTRTFRGLEGEGDTTATEANLLAQASGTKFGAMLQQMNEQPFKRMGRIMVRLNELNVDEARSVPDRAQGREARSFVDISGADLASPIGAELDVSIDVAQKDPDTRIVKLRRATEAFTALAQASQADPALVPLVREAGIKMAEFHDIHDARQQVELGQQALAAQQQQAVQPQQGNFSGVQQTSTEGSQIAADTNNVAGTPN